MFDSYPELLEFNEVCRLLNVSRPTLTRYLKSGKLKGLKMGKRRWKIPKENVIRFLKA